MDTGDILDEEFEDASDEADNEYQFLNDPSGNKVITNGIAYEWSVVLILMKF